MYKKLINADEWEVNDVLKEGYILHSVTPVYSSGNSLFGDKTDLVYHFVKIPWVNQGMIDNDDNSWENILDPNS